MLYPYHIISGGQAKDGEQSVEIYKMLLLIEHLKEFTEKFCEI